MLSLQLLDSVKCGQIMEAMVKRMHLKVIPIDILAAFSV